MAIIFLWVLIVLALNYVMMVIVAIKMRFALAGLPRGIILVFASLGITEQDCEIHVLVRLDFLEISF